MGYYGDNRDDFGNVTNATTREQALNGLNNAYNFEIASLYLAQLHHLEAQEQIKRADEQTGLMLTYTRRMLWLTVAVTILTVINVFVVLFH